MKIQSKRILIVIFPILILSSAAPSHSLSENTTQDRIRHDLDSLQLLRNTVLKRSESVHYYIKALEGYQHDEVNRPIGLGAHRTILTNHNLYYLSFIVSIITYQKKVITAQITVRSPDRERWLSVKDQVEAIWTNTGHLKKYKTGFSHEWSYPEQLGLYRASSGRELGPMRELEIPDHLREAYRFLSSPYESFIFGSFCGPMGSIPRGNSAMDRIINSGRIDIIKNILRSMNPEGRVYAAQALLELRPSKLSLITSDIKAVHAIVNLPIPIRYCSGCFVYDKPARELYEIQKLLKSKKNKTSQPAPESRRIIFTGKNVQTSYTHGGNPPNIFQGRFYLKNKLAVAKSVKIKSLYLISGERKERLKLQLIMNDKYKRIGTDSFAIQPHTEMGFTVQFQTVSFYPAYRVTYGVEATIIVDNEEYTAVSLLNIIRREPLQFR